MKDGYTLRQEKIYNDYCDKSTEFLQEAIDQNKYVSDVLEIIQDILIERKGLSDNSGLQESTEITETANNVMENNPEALLIDQDNSKNTSGRGSNSVLIGLVWMAIGIIITVITYSNASDSGGTYLIAYGPVIYGFGKIISGLFKSGK